MVTTGVCCDSHKGDSSDIFPVCQGSRPDPAWKLVCPSVLTLLVWPCCHGLCEALDCVLSTLSLPEASPAGSRTKPWLWTPEASTVVAALLGWDGWNDIPLQVLVWVWMSRDLAKTLSHFFSCLPVWIAIFSNPAGPGVFSPLQHSHSWAPCIAKHQDPLTPA